MSGQRVRSGLSVTDVAVLGEKEALQRLELLSATSRILDRALDDYGPALVEVAEMCVAEFADLCAIEVIEPDGTIRSAAFRFTRANGLRLPDEWPPIGHLVAFDRRPVLAFESIDEPPSARLVRERFAAQSIIVAPITGGGLTLGWLVAATGAYRRGFRPSALRIGAELSSRLGTAMQRVMLHREMQASAREQSRAVRRLRRLATAATNLAGAATTQAVLDIACVEACVIHEADGAIARWAKSDGSVVEAWAGEIDLADGRGGLQHRWPTAARSGAPGWVAYPLPHTDPWQQAALVVFVGVDFDGRRGIGIELPGFSGAHRLRTGPRHRGRPHPRGPAAGRGRGLARRPHWTGTRRFGVHGQPGRPGAFLLGGRPDHVGAPRTVAGPPGRPGRGRPEERVGGHPGGHRRLEGPVVVGGAPPLGQRLRRPFGPRRRGRPERDPPG